MPDRFGGRVRSVIFVGTVETGDLEAGRDG